MNKILILSDSFYGYGAERMLLWVGKNMARRGNEVVFCSIYDKEKYPLIDGDLTSYELGSERYRRKIIKNIIYYTFILLRVLLIIKRHKFDYAITFQTPPFLLLLILRLFSNFQIIHSERDDPYYRHSLGGKLKMKLYRYADRIVFQTEGARNYFGNEVKERSVVIPNPVKIPHEQWRPHNGHTIINVGRLEIFYKRQDLLIEAFSKVSKKYPDSKLVLCGDGSDKEKLKDIAHEMSIGDNVIFAGKVADVQQRLLDADVFVLSSDTEGMPNALMEAMALGMPVVSTDCSPGGAIFLIANNKNGLLSPRGNILELSNNIIRVLSDSNLSAYLGENARESMKRYDEKKIIKQWASLFNGCYESCEE